VVVIVPSQEHGIQKWELLVAVGVARKRTLTAKSRLSAEHMSKFAALSPIMVTAAKYLKTCSFTSKQSNNQPIFMFCIM
jgi:hypothetical protein